MQKFTFLIKTARCNVVYASYTNQAEELANNYVSISPGYNTVR